MQAEAQLTIPAGTILLGEYGSTSTGVSTAESDLDLAGIVAEEPAFVTGIDTFHVARQSTAAAGAKSGKDDVDVTLHGLRKFAAGVYAGNPNMVVLLYLPKYDVLTDVGSLLIENRDVFLSKHMPKRFLRYLEHQRDALLGITGAKVARQALVDKYGFDVKFAYHAVRVGLQAHELLDDGKLTLPFSGAPLKLLLDIRAGRLTLDDVVAVINDLFETGHEKVAASELPEDADLGAVNRLLHTAYNLSWEGSAVS